MFFGTARAADTKPNVVFILADNVGYGDLGPYGGGAPTPRIDQLAREGLRLTQILVEPACAPSRGRADDGAIFDPQRPVADRRRWQPQYSLRARLHNG
jgi:hypothetical protein